MEQLTDFEMCGRLLCKAYFNGELKPSAIEDTIFAHAVENVLMRGPAYWRALMLGDLARLNTQSRARQLGGGGISPALGEVMRSIDGGVLYSRELILYTCVAKELLRL